MSRPGDRSAFVRARVLVGMAAGVALAAAGLVLAQDDGGVSQSGEQKNMRRVGHVDLQGRPAYQPNAIAYPDGRTIAFAGTHGGSRPNPLAGGVVEQNGTMIIDATDPARPTADRCQEAPHWSFVVDVTVENSKTAPPGTRLEQDVWQGPMVLSTMWVDPRAGEKFPRGNYCTRGARFGVHSSEENFRNPYHGRVTFLAYFTGGVRAWDIREPQAPVEVGFYVPEANANTTPDGYMTNNVEVDDRGFIYATDRNGSGLDILELRGKARSIGLGKDAGHDDE